MPSRNGDKLSIMRRHLQKLLPLSWALALILSVTFIAEARRGSRGGPDESALLADLGGVRFGWSRRETMQHLRRGVRAEYQEKIRRAPGAIEEDRIRLEMNEAFKRLRDGYFEFDGTTTGFDHSYLRGEFEHRNRESMLRHRTPESEDHYFFIDGDHLWKLFRAFRSNTFGGASFEDFCAALEARYGKGVWREGSVRPGEPPTRWLEWEGKTVRVRAIDNSTFYGFYSLVFEDMSIVKRLDKLRPNRGPQGPRRHPVVESVTDDREAVIVVDEHADIADRITGREDREDPKKKKRGR